MAFEYMLADTIAAYENNEFYELLCGKYNHATDEPFDWLALLEYGIHRYYQQSGNESIIMQFNQALSRLLNGDANDVWIANQIIYAQLCLQGKHDAPFELDNALKSQNGRALHRVASQLQNIPYGEMSLFDDIQRLTHCLWQKYRLSMIIV